jgi:hypothetical protein
MSVWSLLLVLQSSKGAPQVDCQKILQKMIINVQNDRTNKKKEPIFNLENDNDFYRHGLIYVIVL